MYVLYSGIIVEPVQAEGGDHHGSAQWFQGLQVGYGAHVRDAPPRYGAHVSDAPPPRYGAHVRDAPPSSNLVQLSAC